MADVGRVVGMVDVGWGVGMVIVGRGVGMMGTRLGVLVAIGDPPENKNYVRTILKQRILLVVFKHSTYMYM